MIRYLFLFIFTCVYMYASSVDCSAVFEARKAELAREVEKIDEATQAQEAIKAANDTLYKNKMQALQKQEEKNKQLLEQIKEQNELLNQQNKKNEDLMKSLKDISKNKLAQTYAKMKESPAASILENMKEEQAASILFALEANKVSKIMSKMDPNIASNITILLKKGPPFLENNQTQNGR